MTRTSHGWTSLKTRCYILFRVSLHSALYRYNHIQKTNKKREHKSKTKCKFSLSCVFVRIGIKLHSIIKILFSFNFFRTLLYLQITRRSCENSGNSIELQSNIKTWFIFNFWKSFCFFKLHEGQVGILGLV